MISLRRLVEKDCEGMLEWMHDEMIQQSFQKSMTTKTKQDVIEFIRAADLDVKSGGCLHYAVTNEEDEYLGTISLKKINLIDRNAEYAISLRAMAQCQGIGMEATQKILQIAFLELELEKVYLNVLYNNYNAIHMYEKCGFVCDGIMRNHIYIRNDFQTLKCYSILKEEYFAKTRVEND